MRLKKKHVDNKCETCSCHKELLPAEMVRAAAAAVPAEEIGIHMALYAISNALACLDKPEWKALHLSEARDTLEVAAYGARHTAFRSHDNYQEEESALAEE